MDSYSQARSAALKELAIAAKSRDLLDQRIARLRQTIASLDVLIEGDLEQSAVTQELQGVGITDAVRNALKIANTPRTAIEVRDWLANSGYDLSEQENALASIHTILKRLVKAEEAEADTNVEGKAVYKWAGGSAIALRSAYYDTNVAALASIREAMKGLAEPTNEAMAHLAKGIATLAQSQLVVEKRVRPDRPPARTIPEGRKKEIVEMLKGSAEYKPTSMQDETGKPKKVVK